MVYQDFNAMQEVIGQLHELSLWNINVHPYHHHTQPWVTPPPAVERKEKRKRKEKERKVCASQQS